METTDRSPASRSALLDDYLTDDQLAAELDISVRTLARWDRLRCGPPIVKVGRKKLRRREAVRAWLQAHERDEVCAPRAA